MRNRNRRFEDESATVVGSTKGTCGSIKSTDAEGAIIWATDVVRLVTSAGMAAFSSLLKDARARSAKDLA